MSLCIDGKGWQRMAIVHFCFHPEGTTSLLRSKQERCQGPRLASGPGGILGYA